MVYLKQTWANDAVGATPISAARLNHIEDGIEAAALVDNVVDLTTDQDVAGEKTFDEVVNVNQLIRVKGRNYADVTHPDFGADPTATLDCATAWTNAFNSLAAGGTLRVPGGTYLSRGPIVWNNIDRVNVETDGQAVTLAFQATNPLTDALRIVDCAQLIFGGMVIHNVAGSANITNLMTVTTTGSAQIARIKDILLDPQAAGVTNCLALAPDSHGDLANITLENVYTGGVGCSGAGLSLGDGISGNVVNIRSIGCNWGHGLYGVYCNGANIQMYGGSFQTNSGADVKIAAQSGSPLVINGVRGESSKMFWEYTNNGQAAFPIKLDGITYISFTEPSSIIMHHAAVHAVELSNMTVYGGLGPAQFLFTSGIAGGSVIAKNILTESDNPFIPHQNVTINWIGPRRRKTGDVVAKITAPVATIQAAAGTGATVSVNGDDVRGTITLTTGTGPSSGHQVRFTYSTVLTTGTHIPPIVSLTPETAATAALQGCVTDKSHTKFDLTTLVPAASTSYVWSYGQTRI